MELAAAPRPLQRWWRLISGWRVARLRNQITFDVARAIFIPPRSRWSCTRWHPRHSAVLRVLCHSLPAWSPSGSPSAPPVLSCLCPPLQPKAGDRPPPNWIKLGGSARTGGEWIGGPPLHPPMGRMETSPTVPPRGRQGWGGGVFWGCIGFWGVSPPPLGLFVGREGYKPPTHQVSCGKSGSVVWESLNPVPAGLVPPSWDSSGEQGSPDHSFSSGYGWLHHLFLQINPKPKVWGEEGWSFGVASCPRVAGFLGEPFLPSDAHLQLISDPSPSPGMGNLSTFPIWQLGGKGGMGGNQDWGPPTLLTSLDPQLFPRVSA